VGRNTKQEEEEEEEGEKDEEGYGEIVSMFGLPGLTRCPPNSGQGRIRPVPTQ